MTTTIFGKTPDSKIKADIINVSDDPETFGVKFPLYDKDNSAKGIFVKTKGFSLLKSEVSQFIRTERGERVMLPNFGLSLKKFLFEPITDDLVEAITEEIYFGFATYLPKVTVRDVKIEEGDNVHGLGLPGLKIQLVVSPTNSTQIGTVEVTL